MGGQLGLVQKNLPEEQRLQSLPAYPREGAKESFSRSWFHKVGTTAEKALLLVEDIHASLDMLSEESAL